MKSTDTDSHEANAVQTILTQCRTVAVVGLSPKPHRDSFVVARYMQAQGWRIVPINPNASEILGEPAYPNLTDAAAHVRIELVNCFRNAADIPPLIEEAIAINAQAVWMQLGIAHPQATAKARAAGLRVVENRCLKIDHAAWRAHRPN